MSSKADRARGTRLTGEVLSFWWAESPMQPTTMAMLLMLDRSPATARVRRAFARVVATVPRLAQRVVEAPFDITLPRWQRDATFDLDYHVRRHALTGSCDLDELFREVAPAYETPFDRSRPLWEARLYDGVGPDGQAGLFFKLHHAFADGVGGNAIFAALTDWERDPAEAPPARTARPTKGAWPELPSVGGDQIAGYFEQHVADKKYTCAEAVYRVAELQRILHLQLSKADAHAVEIGKNIDYIERRQQAPGQFAVQQVFVEGHDRRSIRWSSDRFA